MGVPTLQWNGQEIHLIKEGETMSQSKIHYYRSKPEGDRIKKLEEKCQWASDQFDIIADFIEDNSESKAHAHAQSCAAEMDIHFEELS